MFWATRLLQTVFSENFDSLEIVAKDLTTKIYLDDSEDCDVLLISFLNRIADLGHFEKFNFAIDYFSMRLNLTRRNLL